MGGVLLILNIICGTFFNTVISIYHVKYDNIPFTIISGLAGVLLFVILSSIIDKLMIKKIIMLYGKNSLTILCTHYFILRLIGEISLRTLGVNLWRYTSTPKSILFTGMIILSYYPLLKVLSGYKDNHKWIRYLI